MVGTLPATQTTAPSPVAFASVVDTTLGGIKTFMDEHPDLKGMLNPETMNSIADTITKVAKYTSTLPILSNWGLESKLVTLATVLGVTGKVVAGAYGDATAKIGMMKDAITGVGSYIAAYAKQKWEILGVVDVLNPNGVAYSTMATNRLVQWLVPESVTSPSAPLATPTSTLVASNQPVPGATHAG